MLLTHHPCACAPARVCSRWETPSQPDASGEQMKALRSHLLANPHIKHVFFDFTSMPQGALPPLVRPRACALIPATRSSSAGTRTPEEQRAFELMLVNINILYLGCSVLILADSSYMSRFWTQARAACRFHRSHTARHPELQSPSFLAV